MKTYTTSVSQVVRWLPPPPRSPSMSVAGFMVPRTMKPATDGHWWLPWDKVPRHLIEQSLLLLFPSPHKFYLKSQQVLEKYHLQLTHAGSSSKLKLFFSPTAGHAWVRKDGCPLQAMTWRVTVHLQPIPMLQGRLAALNGNLQHIERQPHIVSFTVILIVFYQLMASNEEHHTCDTSTLFTH